MMQDHHHRTGTHSRALLGPPTLLAEPALLADSLAPGDFGVQGIETALPKTAELP